MNCILLPETSFQHDTAHIYDLAQIAHVNKVLSAKVGDSLKIGQLDGKLGSAIIEDIAPDRIQLGDIQLTINPPPKLNLTVVLALPRPKVLRRLIMDMTALGVNDIILINSYRTQKSYWQSPMLGRLDEFVLEGLQQGVDTIAPRISLQKRFKPFVEDELASLITNRAIVAHPYSALSFSQYVQQLGSNEPPHRSVGSLLPSMVFIGAEGGWIDYEIDLLATQGCAAVNIGPRILRTEAAVNVILGQWLL
ncbi:16S rRNA (uracil(1498)-N(3))-methyltransferase [Psychrobacter sp. ANT_WB68]|uniref:16S rRNA (uracil(1498)-N(3))-methyltransferase n=1 Tax=Psychrobacter sp. ANT_WB68 TaxID=2597355 RepID=UPI0011F19AE9|nr:16S rRNA (uracil(1498)-N(3))-methyltransferase [Psychrobacter sp. ANT_WB68]KAA0914092.1 16S rRNA (uracil(1498)-N(3))-methyltransferase [Psychrobacter sp. ANT_WB68]